MSCIIEPLKESITDEELNNLRDMIYSATYDSEKCDGRSYFSRNNYGSAENRRCSGDERICDFRTETSDCNPNADPDRNSGGNTDRNPCGDSGCSPSVTPDTVVVTISKKTGPVPILPELIRSVLSKNTSQKLTWSKVKGADGYLVYAERCSKENDWYKYEVQAYYIVDGKKVVFGRSLQLHAATKGSKKYANPVAVRIAGSKKRTLKVGKISKIKARVILPKKKKCQWHIAKIQYCVSNPKVVSVANNGKIITKKPGQAIVYVVTQNGVMAKIKVKVRK